jgi:hypothetical protein
MSNKYEYFTSEIVTDKVIYGGVWLGQTFTPSVSHIITSVKLHLYRGGSLETIGVYIRNTSGGVPSGGDLCAVTVAGSTITTDGAGADYEFTFPTPYFLNAGTKYAIVIGVSNGSYPDNTLQVRAAAGGYSGGNIVNSSDSGSSWSADSKDALFEEWGVPCKIFSQSIIIG